MSRVIDIWVSRFFFLIMSISLVSCSSIVNPFCCDPSRPTVIREHRHWIIDYNDCFKEYELDREDPVLQAIERKPITQEMLDPFEPLLTDYRFSRGDLLDITVFGEAEVSVKRAVIAPDGKLYFTVLPGIDAVDLTPDELQEELTMALMNYYKEPLVIVNPLYNESVKYRILGRVRGPGEYPFLGATTLREAISDAGGLLSATDRDDSAYGELKNVEIIDFARSFVVRDGQKIDIDFKKLFLGEESQNIYLHPNDYIYIAGNDQRDIFVLGAVNGPQRLPYESDLTLMSALTLVGGWPYPSPYSPDLKRILVIRGSLHCPKVCVVDLRKIIEGQARDVNLEPGDIIYASHKPFRFAREMIQLAIDSFIYTFVDSATYHLVRFHIFREDEGEADETTN